MIEITRKFSGARVVVIGDLIADEYVYGRVARVSREAPVLILEYDSTEIVPGGAGNAAANVAALGGQVRLVSLVGRDEAGRRVLARAARRASIAAGLVRPAGYRTPVKTRILAGGIHSAKQQVVRIDRMSPRAGRPTAERAAMAARGSTRPVRDADAVLISDYGSGLCPPALVATHGRADRVRAPARAGAGGLALRADALSRAHGLHARTNRKWSRRSAYASTMHRACWSAPAARILKRTRMQAVLVTRGSRGMALFEPGRPTRAHPHLRVGSRLPT